MSETKKNQCFLTKEENLTKLEDSLRAAVGLLSELEMIWRHCGEYEEIETFKQMDKLGMKIMCASAELKWYADGSGYHDSAIHPISETSIQYSQLDMNNAIARQIKITAQSMRDQMYTQEQLDEAVAKAADEAAKNATRNIDIATTNVFASLHHNYEDGPFVPEIFEP